MHGDVSDWSALEEVQGFSRLSLNVSRESYETILPYLEGKNISCLQLEWMNDIDLSRVPSRTGELQISGTNLTDLSGLPNLNLRKLILYDMQELTSLNGIEALKDNRIFRALEITGCPRLTDWSALDGMTINELSLVGTYTMPDLGSIKPTTLRLDSLGWLEDLSCLDALDGDRDYNLDLLGLDLVTDMSPVKRLKGYDLRVSPLLKEQAESLVEEGRFRNVEIVYPDSWWNVWKGEVELKSLEELDTLPLAALRQVRNLTLAGDLVINWDAYDVWERWEDEGRYYVLYDKYNDVECRLETGTMTDLSRLSQLTGLVSLEITEQPLTSLEGIDGMTELEELRLRNCRQLEDISPAFALELIRRLELTDVPVSSIQGIQNLYELRNLSLHDTHVSDISPLAGCDLTAAYRDGGLSLDIKNREEYMVADCTPLESIEKFDYVPLNEGDVYDWLPHMQNAVVSNLCIDNIHTDRTTDLTLLGSVKAKSLRIDSFDQLTSLHGLEELIASGTLEELEILSCPRLTDWSALESGYLPKLWLYSTFDIPDMSRMDIGTLRLEQLNWLKDLKQLETIGQEREINIELVDLANLKDLSSLKKIKGNRLAVTEDLLNQARNIAAGGSFRSSEIADGDGWGASNDQFQLVSLEEIETLPESVLSHVTEAYLVGDRLIDRNWYWTEWDWDHDQPMRRMYDREKDEWSLPDFGTMPDLTCLAKLTGLKTLEIEMAGITSLAGLENMPDLEQLHIRCAPNLTDVSVVWELKNLQSIEFNMTALDSIDGVENLKMLRDFGVYGSGLKDISVLKKCDFSYAYQNGGLNIDLSIDNEADASPLETIKKFNWINIGGNEQIDQWLPHVRNAEAQNMQLRDYSGTLNLAELPHITERLELHNIPDQMDLSGLKGPGPHTLQLDNLSMLTSLDGIRELIGEGGIREIRIGGCPRLTDWSAVEGTDLEKIVVYGDLVFVPESLQDKVERTNGDDEWWSNNAQFILTSLDELDELPEEVLGSIRRLWLAGNGIYDWDSYGTWWYEENGEQVVQLNRYDSDEHHVEHMGTMTDLTRLAKLTGLEELYLDLQGLTSLDGLENLTNLEVLWLRTVPNLKDISAIGNLPNLRRLQLQLNNGERMENLDILRTMNNLESIRIYDNVADISALAECDFNHAYENGGLDMYLATDGEADLTPLESIREFSSFQLDWDRPGRYSPYLQNAVIHSLQINGANDLRLEILPAASDRLELHNLPNITDLTGLKGPGPHTLQLDDLPDLVSLDGIREMIGEGGIREIQIGGCPRIADWSALEGTDLEKIRVCGEKVYVPESLQDKVERIESWDGWWTSDDEIMFQVTSAEDLMSLPEAARQAVTDLFIAGGDFYKPQGSWIEDRGANNTFVVNDNDGEGQRFRMGKAMDLSFLSGLSGLTNLTLAAEPITDLEALRPLTRLMKLNVSHCTKLKDISAIADMPELEELQLNNTAVTSLEPLRGHTKIMRLDLNGLRITDLDILGELDYAWAEEHGGMNLSLSDERIRDFSFMSAIPKFSWLGIANLKPALWMDAVSSAQIRSIYCSAFTQDQLVQFLEQHPELEQLHIQDCKQVKDVSMLDSMPNLEYVFLSDRMKKTMEGTEHRFEIR